MPIKLITDIGVNTRYQKEYPDIGIFPDIGMYPDHVFLDIGVNPDIRAYPDIGVNPDIGVYPDHYIH